MAEVVARLTTERLPSPHTNRPSRLAHEALIREWPRVPGMARRRRAEPESTATISPRAPGAGRPPGRDTADLYRGARLSAANEWSVGRENELNSVERDFLSASRANAELDAERQRRQNRRLRMLLVGAVVLLAVAVAGGLIALSQRSSAQDHARVALARQLGAEAIVEPRLDRAMLLAREAARLDPSAETSGDLLSALLRSPAAIATFTVPITVRPLRLALSPDGKTLAVNDNQDEENKSLRRRHAQAAPSGSRTSAATDTRSSMPPTGRTRSASRTTPPLLSSTPAPGASCTSFRSTTSSRTTQQAPPTRSSSHPTGGRPSSPTRCSTRRPRSKDRPTSTAGISEPGSERRRRSCPGPVGSSRRS